MPNPLSATAAGSEQRIEATLVGGPTLVLRYAGLVIVTDPTFDPPGTYDLGVVTLVKRVGPALSIDEVPMPDLVLLSHDQHPDNLDSLGRRYLSRAGTVLSTSDAAFRVAGVTGMSPWSTHAVGPLVQVTAVPARHGPESSESAVGQVTGFVLQAPGWPGLYVSGDNASLDVADSIAERFPGLEVVVPFAGAARTGRLGGARLTMGAREIAAVASLFPAARVVPTHAADWAHFTETPADIQAAFHDAGMSSRLVTLSRGEPTLIVAGQIPR